MPNIFDAIQTNTFGIISTTFGYAATWEPLDGTPLQAATVLYKDATEKEGLSDSNFNIERYIIEFANTEFVGLKKSVDAGENEKVRVTMTNGVLFEFMVRRMETKYDGKTIVAILNEPTQIL